MKSPRVSIAGLMIFVAFAAANFAIVGGFLARPSVWKEMCLFGALPMANLLAAGLLPWLRRRAEIDGFRVGFEVAGALAMATFLALTWRYTDTLFRLPQSIFRPYLELRPGFGLVSVALLIFLGPQVAFALLGGRLGRLIFKSSCDHSATVAAPPAGVSR